MLEEPSSSRHLGDNSTTVYLTILLNRKLIQQPQTITWLIGVYSHCVGGFQPEIDSYAARRQTNAIPSFIHARFMF